MIARPHDAQADPPGLISDLGSLLSELERLIEGIPLEDEPALLGDLERLKAKLWMRMMGGQRSAAVAPAPPTPTGDQLLTVKKAAEMLGVTKRWVYGHKHDVGALVDLPGRSVRFSRRKLEKWLAQRTP